jgi:hypothetical protein
VRLSALYGVLQNQETAMIVGNRPFFDLVQGSKTTQTGEVIAQTAISYARRLSGYVDITHGRKGRLRGLEFDHTGARKSG